MWWYLKPERLRADVRREIADADGVLISAVSGFEIALKHWLGKMPEAGPLVANFTSWAAAQGFELLDVTVPHALAAGSLDWSHKDPFDRLLVAQALVDDLTLVSNEEPFDRTGVRRLW